MVNPIFVLSLPRTGSTLVQRILAAHSDIATTSEPWLLLPLIYARRPSGAYAEYSHGTSASALNAFARRIDMSGATSFDSELRTFALRTYEAGAAGRTYFLDKTPRYHLIAQDILDLFPEAKIIFLWRHPLATVASILATFGRGRWNLFDYSIDLFDGLENLLAASAASRERSLTMNYEDLLIQPQQEVGRIWKYLDLPPDDGALTRFTLTDVRGPVGDPTVDAYDRLSSEPLNKWRSELSNPIRRWWAQRYLAWIGKSRLESMGYDYDQIRAELASIEMRGSRVLSDVWRLALGEGVTAARASAFTLSGSRPIGARVLRRSSIARLL